MTRQLLLLTIVTVLVAGAWCWATESNKKLEETLLKPYNRKHRPVKKEYTTMQIQVYLLISHVEKVDEHEQTMMLHGLLWATWVDEYLQWDPSKYNNTRRIAIESWKIWQPALSLYNSARGNSWYLHMGGLPASVSSDGKIWASGSFSFHVTCMFDFTNYPYDEQECPIVVADWVYDLSKVNLSDPSGNTPWNKPAVKLSYDPLNTIEPKKHVAGWEVQDTWRRQCYWGPTGCKDESPDGQPEWYWSLIEFGIKIKRSAPYFGLTIILPSLITSMLTLSVFWIDTSSLAIAVTTFNILLQGLFGWDLVKKLPPGSGTTPKIVSLYGFNLTLTAIAFILHVVINYLESALPENIELPFKMTNITERLRRMSPFSVKGLSFDPQRLLLDGTLDDDKTLLDRDQNPPSALVLETDDETQVDGVQTTSEPAGGDEIALESTKPMAESSTINKQAVDIPELGHVAQQLYIVRRIMFFLYLIMYVITLPICLL